MHIERLNHLIAILRNVEAAHRPFDLGAWVNNVNLNGWRNESPGVVGDIDQTCGTTCCAMGYAALDPQFRAEGLELIFQRDSRREVVDSIAAFNAAITTPPTPRWDDFAAFPMFDGKMGFAAAAAFFSIEKRTAWSLFQKSYYRDTPAPADVIARIQTLIEMGETPEFKSYVLEVSCTP